tara:strand:- start:1641 stop:4028 length:2388 start_codon:yes stop_codon:yes gene_type:complete
MAITPEELSELNALERERLDLNERGLELETRKIKRLRELRRLEDDGIDAKKNSLEYDRASLDLLEERIQKAEILKKQGLEVTGLYAAEIEQAEKLLDIAEKQLDRNAADYEQKLADIYAAKEANDARRKGYNEAEGFAKRFFGITKEPKSLASKFLLNPEKMTEGLIGGLKEVITPMSVMTSTMDKVIEASVALTIEQDSAVVSFRKATGASGDFDDNIRGLEQSLFMTGVTSAEASQAVQTLFINVTDFTEMSEGQQETLGKTVAVLGELGVASETTAKNIQFATKALGMSTSAAAGLQRELFTFAQDLGVSANQIASDFQQMGPQIAAMGANGVDAFRNLEAQSKSTGLAMNELLQIVQKFDRFDTAAESVGRLNALLGGPFLNATELVAETDLSRRFEILKSRIDDAGLSFDQMDYYQRKAVASAMGLNEQQLALLMRGRVDLVQAPAKSAEEIEALADQTAQFNTIAEEMMQIARGLAIGFGPVVSAVKDFLQLLSPLIENLDVIAFSLGGAAIAMGGVSAATVFQTIVTNGLTAAMRRNLIFGGIAAFLPLLAMLAPQFKSITVGIGMMTAAMYALSVAEKSTVVMGAAGILIGIFGALVHSMTVGNSPSLVEAFMMVAAAIPFMGLALMALLPLLPGLLLFIPPLALGFAMVASSLEQLFADKTVTNLQLISAEIANIVDKINEIDTTKAIAVTATTAVAAAGGAISGIAAGAMDAIGINVGGGAATPAPAMAVASGPPAEIKLNIVIDGESIAGAINNVEVSNYVKGQRSKLHDTIVDIITGTKLTTG